MQFCLFITPSANVLTGDSLGQLVSARHGDHRFARRRAVPFLLGSPCCDWQRPLTPVHFGPEVTAEPPAGT